jgi:hypothetical protein
MFFNSLRFLTMYLDAGENGGGEPIDIDKMTPEQLKEELKKMRAKTTTPPPVPPKKKPVEEDEEEDEDEDDLSSKAKKNRREREKNETSARKVEGAVIFNTTVGDFIKNNSDILPSDIPEILEVAKREKYDSQSDQATALKLAIIKSFFSQKDNVDVLTASQKRTLEEFNNLTKNAKEEKSESIYENLFEPALEAMRRVRKAEEAGKARKFGTSSSVESDYQNRMIAAAKLKHLGVKE